MPVSRITKSALNDVRKPLLTVTEACEILHIHQNTLRRWNDQGLVKSIRLGPRGDRRFRQEDIVAIIVEQSH